MSNNDDDDYQYPSDEEKLKQILADPAVGEKTKIQVKLYDDYENIAGNTFDSMAKDFNTTRGTIQYHAGQGRRAFEAYSPTWVEKENS